MTVYPIVTTLTGFQFTNLLPYILQVVSTVTGYYTMKEIPTTPLLPNAPLTQDFSKLGFVYITVLGLVNQFVPHTGSWCPLATALNYLVCIASIVYTAFQAWPASPVRVQPDSGMGRDN
ncbi:hypothetical protein DSO57_1023809 [Entomophthora muscae]|uniref:Uncharacterized protein n=1 Tax=Entomophthora muscae TaxID=34485 RepID=A0ACC2UBS8_9FUNG|nr:hypothetical protein DSO57_1023809 [Entomophthora muscae]